MFKEMRRKDKQLSVEESIEILKSNEIGVLSTICENGYPYGIALNYVYYNNSIYFHGAKEGQKLDNIKNCDKVSFLVTSDVQLLPEDFNTKYKSVILFGRAGEINSDEKAEILTQFVKKYSNDFLEKGKEYVKESKDLTTIIKIKIEHLSGKAYK